MIIALSTPRLLNGPQFTSHFVPHCACGEKSKKKKLMSKINDKILTNLLLRLVNVPTFPSTAFQRRLCNEISVRVTPSVEIKCLQRTIVLIQVIKFLKLKFPLSICVNPKTLFDNIMTTAYRLNVIFVANRICLHSVIEIKC